LLAKQDARLREVTDFAEFSPNKTNGFLGDSHEPQPVLRGKEMSCVLNKTLTLVRPMPYSD
jgi:hypothetical protein